MKGSKQLAVDKWITCPARTSSKELLLSLPASIPKTGTFKNKPESGEIFRASKNHQRGATIHHDPTTN
jgi:hypothetical protein